MLVQFGCDPCSLLANTAQLRLTQDHVLNSESCYAALDEIINLQITNIRSVFAVLI